MEDQTQAVIGDEEEQEDEESVVNPVGYLRVLCQKDLEQEDYPIQEGEVTIGRGSDCELVIQAKSLSRKHATVLVEGGTHFILDLDSRNKTHRGTVQLRPNAYYELTHGCELTFADIKCVYYIGSLPEEEEEGAAANEEATQAYGVGEEEEVGGDREDGDEADGDDDANVEPTQAYHFDGEAGAADEEEDMEGEPMDCEATVAYHIETDGGDKESDNDDSPPSSPILVATKQLQSKQDISEINGSGTSSGAKKPSKKVCFATRTVSGSVEEATSTSKTSVPEEEGAGDESDDEETDIEESTQPCWEEKEEQEKEGKEKDSEDGGKGRTITSALKETEAGAGSAMDVDDPTVAYELETDEEKTDTEERGRSKDGGESREKEEGPTKDSGGAEPTVPYNLKEEDEDSDETDVEQEENEPAPELSKVTKELEAKAASGSAEKEEVLAKEPTEEHSEETEDGGDTEKVESSATEPESQEVKEKPAHLRPSPRIFGDAKALSSVSLMDCMEKVESGDTVQLDSYVSSCDETVPLNHTPPVAAFSKEARVSAAAVETIHSPVAAKEERESVDGKEEEEPQMTTLRDEVKKEEESDSSDGCIPDLPRLGSKGIGGSNHSRQKTLFEAVSSRRGRGRGSRRGQGRKAPTTRKGSSKTEEPSCTGEAEAKKEIESKSDVERETALDLKTEEDTDKKNVTTTDSEALKSDLKTVDSIGGISGKVATLRLKSLTLVTPSTSNDRDSRASANASNETAATSEGAEVKRGRGRGRKGTASRQTRGTRSGQSKPITEKTTGAKIGADSADFLQEEEESPDLPFFGKTEDQSDHTNKSHDHEGDANDQSDHSSSATPSASLELLHGGRGRKGKGRGGASKRGKAAATPRSKSTETTPKTTPKTRTPSSTPFLRHHRTPSSSTGTVSKSPSSTPGETPPKIMFTGLIDKDGERTIRELGGELVDSVYQCTHLITDKVRRTVKFLCCLSRGCLIISDAWLDQCALEKRFLSAEPYLIKDKPAERQHKFSLQRSHESAKITKLLAGYKVYLTPNVKPEREHMSDIIKCSGGEVFDFGPSFSPGPGEKAVVIACEEDLGICKDIMESGVPVHSTELILGGVLRQELELHNHLMSVPSSSASTAGRKRRAKEPSLIPAAKRKRK